jgi:hypothetical protein
LARQVSANRASAESWNLFSPHRKRLTQLISRCLTDLPSLCILGAGNCNDVDLVALSAHFTEIHLVDIDEEALERGVSRQPVARSDIELHGKVDVTGVVEILDDWSHGSPVDAEVDKLCSEIERIPHVGLGTGSVGVVVSATVLTQLIDSVVVSLRPDHPRMTELVTRLRDAHLRLLVHLLAPGGVGMLVSDLVSTSTYRDIGDVQHAHLFGVMRRLVSTHNFFTGANPFAIVRTLLREADFSQAIDQISLHQPWLWNSNPGTMRLVYAITFAKRTGT